MTTTSTSYITVNQYLSQWERNDSIFTEIQEITLDELLASTSVAGSVELALFDQTETQVDGSELSHSGATITQKIATLTASSNFSDLESYHLSLKATGSGQTASLFKAGLWIKLSNLTRAREYFRLGTTKNTSTSYWSYNYRYPDRSSSYSNPEINLLIKAATTLNGDGTSLEFWDTTTSDTGITQNVLTVSSALSTTATWQTLGPLTLTPGQRYQLYHRIGSGETSEMHGAFLTIDASN